MRIITRRDTGLLTQWTFGARAADPDALAFLTAAGITDPTITASINNLVISLKGFGIWTKLNAIYPFVGGTASTHKFNLKNPVDTNAAFRLNFVGGWTHSSNGALPNGTNAYADTFLDPSTVLPINNLSLSYYSRTQSIVQNGGSIGQGINGGNLNSYLTLYYQSELRKFFLSGVYPTNAAFINNTNTLGLQIGSQTSSASRKLYFNNTLLATNTTNNSFTRPSFSYYLGGLNYSNVASFFASYQCAFSSIGSGLTDTEASNLYISVQAFQTANSRQV
jgi:hypothetical protein